MKFLAKFRLSLPLSAGISAQREAKLDVGRDLICLLSEPISHRSHLAAAPARSFYFRNISVAPSKNKHPRREFSTRREVDPLR